MPVATEFNHRQCEMRGFYASLFRNQSRELLLPTRSVRAFADPLCKPRYPSLQDAELAAIYYGQRMGGDFYDFLRVSPCRVVFGLLDVAGRVEDSRAIITATQTTFRTVATELLSRDGVNESEAMVELGTTAESHHSERSQGSTSLPGIRRLLQRRPGDHLLREFRSHPSPSA